MRRAHPHVTKARQEDSSAVRQTEAMTIGRFRRPTEQELIARGPVFTLFDFALLIDSPSGQAREGGISGSPAPHRHRPVASRKQSGRAGHVHRGGSHKRPGPNATVRSRTLPLNEVARAFDEKVESLIVDSHDGANRIQDPHWCKGGQL